MNCPKCAVAMTALKYADVTVDRCAGCGGIWLDALEDMRLRALAGAEVIDAPPSRPGAAEVREATGSIGCPRCGRRMLLLMVERTPPIYFEHCGGCGGVFLDAGELREMKSTTLEEWLRAGLPGVFKLRLADGESPS